MKEPTRLGYAPREDNAHNRHTGGNTQRDDVLDEPPEAAWPVEKVEA
jgi:hypothetical protein